MNVLLHQIGHLVLRLFYSRIDVIGAENLPRKGAVIFLGNHSNSLIDPFIVSAFTNSPPRLSAKRTLFDTPLLGGLMRAMHVIPLYRSQDHALNERQSANRSSLIAMARCLQRGESVLLFPEGKSHDEMEMLPFKSGAARLALIAEREFRLADARPRAHIARPPAQTAVIPFGIAYAAKSAFRSRVIVCFGPRLNITDWIGAHPHATAQELTAEFRTRVEKARSRSMEALASLEVRKPHNDLLKLSFQTIGMAGLGLIPSLLGILIHVLPAGIAWRIAEKLSQDEDQFATNFLFVATPLFCAFYLALFAWLAFQTSLILALGGALIWIGCGLISLRFYDQFSRPQSPDNTHSRHFRRDQT